MPIHITSPSVVEAEGKPPKLIRELVGGVNTGDDEVSIARMSAPAGWVEPGQTPEFDEYTVVLEGVLRVETTDGELEVAASEAVIVRAGEWVRYSTPAGAEYIAVCLPAFTPARVHRDSL